MTVIFMGTLFAHSAELKTPQNKIATIRIVRIASSHMHCPSLSPAQYGCCFLYVSCSIRYSRFHSSRKLNLFIDSTSRTVSGQWGELCNRRDVWQPNRGGSKDLGLLVVELSGDTQSPANRDQLLSWQSAVRLSGFSASGQFAAAELILISTTKPLRRRPDRTQLLLLLMAGDIHPNPGPTVKYPCPVCARDVTSRGVSYRCTRCTGWVHAKCSGLLNAAQYRRNKDWTCDPCSASKTKQSTPPPPSPPPTPAPSAE